MLCTWQVSKQAKYTVKQCCLWNECKVKTKRPAVVSGGLTCGLLHMFSHKTLPILMSAIHDCVHAEAAAVGWWLPVSQELHSCVIRCVKNSCGLCHGWATSMSGNAGVFVKWVISAVGQFCYQNLRGWWVGVSESYSLFSLTFSFPRLSVKQYLIYCAV